MKLTDILRPQVLALAGLTGGGTTKLDGVVSLGAPVGLVLRIAISGKSFVYELKSGTTAESSPTIIRPDDYATTTNERYWQLIAPANAQSTLTYAATTDIDLALPGVRVLALTGNVTFTTSNRLAEKEVRVKIAADASIRTFTFPSWKWLGAAPANIAASKTGLLTLICFGTADTDILADWRVET